MRIILILVGTLIAAPLTRAADPPSGLLGRYPEDFFFGEVQGRRAYSCQVDHNNKEGLLPSRAVDLLDGPLAGPLQVSRTNLPFRFAKNHRRDPLRWRIAHGFYWAVSVIEIVETDSRFSLVRIPLADLPRIAQGIWPVDRPAIDRVRRPVNLERAPGSTVPYVVADLEPMETYVVPGRAGPEPVYYDILPTSAESCTLFIHGEGQIHVSHCTLKASEVELKFDDEPQWTKQQFITAEWSETPAAGPTPRVIRAAWSEPFYAVARGTSLFFVTELGRVFHARRAADGRWATEEVWGNDRPIVGLIVEAASGRAFAFGRLHRFEVQDEITPVPCNMFMNMPPWSEPTKPHERVLWAAQLLGQRDLPKGPVPAVGPAGSDRGRTPE